MKKLSQIIDFFPLLELKNMKDVLIENISSDSRLVKNNSIFFSVNGLNKNGKDFENQAIQKGANVIISENELTNCVSEIVYIRVENIRKVIAIVANFFFDNPSKKIKVIGVTGTNGKSSVVNFLFQIFSMLGYKTGLISTVNYIIGNEKFDSTHTTPDSISLNYMLNKMVIQKCEYCFMEVSSHALAQYRVYGVYFDIGVFTNITHEHIDYHKTFKNYLNAKKIFFDSLASESILITNLDDENGLKICSDSCAEIKTYSLKKKSDYSCKIIKSSFHGMKIKINNCEINTRVCGEFNAYNLLATYATCLELKLNKEKVLNAISNIVSTEGRFDVINTNNFISILDYAHTDDALKNVFKAISKITKRKIVVVFGCGGNRDKYKRPLMVKVANEFSDFIIITSDNPRNESFDDITHDMLSKSKKDDIKKYVIIKDREQAIKLGCLVAGQQQSVLLVSGKGHEKFQEINGKKIPFDDRKIIIKYS